MSDTRDADWRRTDAGQRPNAGAREEQVDSDGSALLGSRCRDQDRGDSLRAARSWPEGCGRHATMRSVNAYLQALAANVRALRESHGLSLSQLSERSGVGKATLFKIEQAQTNPTLETMTLIAETFDVQVAELIAHRARAGVEVVRAGEGDRLLDDSSEGHALRKQVVAGGVLSIDSARFFAGKSMLVPSHGVGAREHILVREGSIEIGPTGEEVVLHAGDYATFLADRPHRWRPVDGDASVWILGTFPRPAAFGEQEPDGP